MLRHCYIKCNNDVTIFNLQNVHNLFTIRLQFVHHLKSGYDTIDLSEGKRNLFERLFDAPKFKGAETVRTYVRFVPWQVHTVSRSGLTPKRNASEFQEKEKTMEYYNPLSNLQSVEYAPAVDTKNGASVEICTIKNGEKDVILRGRDAIIANRLQFFQEVTAQSGKAIACYLSYFTKETAELYGFGAVGSIIKSIASKLDGNTISKYRKVGLLFGYVEEDGTPQWRDAIPADTTVTNLSSVLGLASQGKKLEDLTEEERDALYIDFVNAYLDPVSPRLHLQATLSKLRQEVSDIQSTIGEGATGSKKKSNGKKKEEDKSEELSPIDKARVALDTLFSFFEGNTEALGLLDAVQTVLEGKIPEEAPEEAPAKGKKK